jgi:hypothetical protein
MEKEKLAQAANLAKPDDEIKNMQKFSKNWFWSKILPKVRRNLPEKDSGLSLAFSRMSFL